MERDLYEILGVPKGASASDLKKAHRKLVREFHPDVNKSPGADKKFAEIQDAYDILSDTEKRKLYDQFGHAGVKAGAAGGGAGTSGAGGRRGGDPFGGAAGGGDGWQGVDPGSFEEIFGSMFGGRGGRGATGQGGFGRGGAGSEESPRATQGHNIEAEETIDFTTSILGGSRSFRLNDSNIEVRIPAGIVDGAKLAVRGKGHAGTKGGSAGDLVITIHVATHPWIRRSGDDLIVEVPLTITEAALGATLRIPLLDGSVQIKVPAGVRSGQKLRVKGKGVQRAKGEPGDFYAALQIEAPKELTDRQRELLQELSPTLPSPRTGAQWAQ